jgi:multiple sugar transport system substrate-binding protein
LRSFLLEQGALPAGGLDLERPPKTWKNSKIVRPEVDPSERAGEIERAGYIPGYWDPFGTALFAHWALQKGARFLSEDGTRVDLTSSACVEALEWEANLFERLGRDDLIKLRASFGYGSQQGFSSGRVSMIAQKSSFIEELAQFAPNLEYGVAPFPLPEGGKPAVMFGAVWIGIPASAEHPEEAWEFIKYYTQASVQKRIADFLEEQKLVGFFPANIEAAGTPARLAKPGMAVFLESMQWAHTPTVIPLAHAVFWREYGNAWDEAVRGLKPARVALANAEKIIQDALDDQLEYDEFYRKYLRQREETQERNRMAQVPVPEESRIEVAGRKEVRR